MNNKIDIKLKDLADQQLASPPAFVWDNIATALQPEKKSRLWILWFLGAALLLAGSIYFLVGKNQKPEILASSITASNDTNKENNDVVSVTANEIAENETIFEDHNIASKIESPNIAKVKIAYSNTKGSSKTSAITSESAIGSEIILTASNDNSENKPISNVIQPMVNDQINISQIQSIISLLAYEADKYKLNNDIVCPSFGGGKRISTFLELGGLVGSHSKTLSNGTNPKLAELRDMTESSWYTWGFYGAFGVNLSPSFYIGAGLDWTQSKDKFYSAEDAITKMIITFDPSSGLPIDTSFVTGNLGNQGEVRHNMTDIPVFLGYTKNYGKWDFGIEGGVIFNLDFVAEGKVYDSSLKLSNHENIPDVYKSSVGMGMKASLLIRRNLGNGLSLQFKPGFKTYLGDINGDSYALPTRYKLFGLNIGLRKDF